MKLLLVFCLTLISLCCDAATITADSASRIDVGTAIDSASDGDTVIIPAGSPHWTTNLTITKAITLQGSGTNSTIIFDDIPQSAYGISALDPLISVVTVSNKFYRVTNFKIADATTRTSLALALGQITVFGYSKAVRIDNMWFGKTLFREKATRWYDAACGVVDHCTMLNPVRQFDVIHNHWGNSSNWVDGYGDGSWAADNTMGTTNTVMYEDCYMEMSSVSDAFTDCFDGGRYCIRHCTLKNGHLDSHEGGSRTRATRQVEIYNNTLTCDSVGGELFDSRGGAIVIFSNTLVNVAKICDLVVNRSYFNYSPWFMMNGTNIWDNNPPSAAFTGNFVGPNGDQYISGTSCTITITNVNWTTNQWVGYSLVNRNPAVTNNFGHFCAPVQSNTTNKLTYYFYPGISLLVWTNGDTASMYYVTNGMDNCGMGKGILLIGDEPPYGTVSPMGWPQEIVEGCYEWANTDVAVHFSTAQPVVREGFHYFNNTAKPGYVPLVYPHPLVQSNAPAPPVTGNVTTVGKIYF